MVRCSMSNRIHRARVGLALFAVAYGTNVSTPLLLLYQERLELSAWTVTALFAVYPLGLIPALILGGPSSDVLGRKRLLLPFLILSGLASLIFIPGADHLGLLYLGRLLLGVSSGVVFLTASAWMQELRDPDDPIGPARLTGVIMYSGFGLGPLLSGAMGQWLPAPTVAPFVLHISIVAAAIVALGKAQETVELSPGRRIRINLGIPPGRTRAFFGIVLPTALGVFGLASVAFGLFPVLLRPHMDGIELFVTGLVAGTTTSSTFVAQPLVTRLGPRRAAPLALFVGTAGYAFGTVAFTTGLWPLLLPAALLLGYGSGASLTSGLRFVDVLTDPDHRGALAGSFYAVAYAGMTMPVVAASLAGPTGFTPVLAAFTVLAGVGAIWLSRETRVADYLP